MSDETTTHLHPLGQTAPLRVVRELFLDVTGGPDAGTSAGPLSPPIRVGSARGNDVVLSDSTVSRFHFAIEWTEEGLLLKDCGSRNGTFLGPHRVKEAFVQDATSVRVGDTQIGVRFSREPRYLEVSERERFGDLLGQSASMRALFATLERLARADAPVLIEGETGTGKELVARALHSEGSRSEKPFVVVDCGSVAPTLVESELFGHTKGAFTGADEARAGAFQLGHGGTVFLDELGELPLALQPKLLRVLETGTVKALGAGREQKVDVRVVAATHRDLRRMVNAGSFREDLYFRLAVCPVRVPPLRERLEDLPILARHFLGRALAASAPAEATTPEPTAETLQILRARPWTGNVRELRNVIERAVIFGEAEDLAKGDLAPTLRHASFGDRLADETHSTLEELKRRFEREYLERLLVRFPDDRDAAAKEAGLHPKSLQRLLRRHGLRSSDG